jgi:nucleoside-triphosphatase
MAKNVFIAGKPGIGKTELVTRLYHDLVPLVIRGFYKEALYEFDILKGYRIVSFDFKELILAHVHLVGPERQGEFGLNIDGFDDLIGKQLDINPRVELFLIDEIGAMECLSQKFRKKTHDIIDSNIPLIATLASIEMLDILKIKERKDISILTMTHKNREGLWKNVMVELSKTTV